MKKKKLKKQVANLEGVILKLVFEHSDLIRKVNQNEQAINDFRAQISHGIDVRSPEAGNPISDSGCK